MKYGEHLYSNLVDICSPQGDAAGGNPVNGGGKVGSHRKYIKIKEIPTHNSVYRNTPKPLGYLSG